MNGRVYDYNVGRFTSVDPFIQGTGSQAINPYSYIQNNPLSGTDPTGYCASKDELDTCLDSIDPGKSSEITNDKGKAIGTIGKDKNGQVYVTRETGSKGANAITSAMGGYQKNMSNLNSNLPNMMSAQKENYDNKSLVGKGLERLGNITNGFKTDADTTQQLYSKLEDLGSKVGCSTDCNDDVYSDQELQLMSGLTIQAAIYLPNRISAVTKTAPERSLVRNSYSPKVTAEIDASAYNLTEAMNDKKYTSLVNNIGKNGLQNPRITYTIINGERYILHGNNRLLSTKHLGQTGKLSFNVTTLPARGPNGTTFRTVQEVLDGASKVRLPRYRGNTFKPK